MFPTLLASFYGMNVPLPFADHDYAFYFILVAALLFAAMILFLFKRSKML
jgi:magnesium transporter